MGRKVQLQYFWSRYLLIGIFLMLGILSFSSELPTIVFNGIGDFSIVSGKVQISVSVSDVKDLKYLSLYIDESYAFSVLNKNTLEYTLDTTKMSNGLHTLLAVATDVHGNKHKKRIVFNVNNVFESMNILFTEPDLKKINHVINISHGGILMVGEIAKEDGTTDIYIVKLDDNGNVVWFKIFGGPGNDKALYVVELPDGGFLLCGSYTNENGDTDVLVMKLDENGEIVWWKTFGGSADDVAYMIQILPDGEILLLVTVDDEDAFVLIDELGNVVEIIPFGIEIERPRIVDVLPDGGYLLFGDTCLVEVPPIVTPTTDSSGGKPSGTKPSTIFELPFDGKINDVAKIPDGKYMLVGERYLKDGKTDGFIIIITLSGKIVWQRFFEYIIGFDKIFVTKEYYTLLGRILVTLPYDDRTEREIEVPYVLFMGFGRCILAEYILPVYTNYGGKPVDVIQRKDKSIVVASNYQEKDKLYVNLQSLRPSSTSCDNLMPTITIKYIKEDQQIKKILFEIKPKYVDNVSYVNLTIDDEEVASMKNAPYVYEWSDLRSGEHTIRVYVGYTDGREGYIEQKIFLVIIPKIVTRDWSTSFGAKLNEIGTGTISLSNGFAVTSWVEPEGEQTSDIYLIVLGNDGKVRWTKSYGDIRNDGSWGLIQTDDDNIVIVGWTEKDANKGTDVYVLKVNNQGDIIWEKVLGDVGNDIGVSVQKTSDNCLMVFGITELSGAQGSLIYVSKLSNNGELLWEKKYGFQGYYNYIGNVLRTSGDNYLIAGTVIRENGQTDGFAMELDRDGNLLWQKIYADPGNQWISSLVEVDDGYVLVGHSKAYLIFEDGQPSGNDIYLMHIGKTGEIIKKRTIMEIGEQRAYSVVKTKDKQLMLGTNVLKTDKNDWDIRALKVNLDFEITWEKIFEREGMDQIFGTQSLTIVGDGSYVLTGGSIGDEGNWDVRIIKFIESK